MKTKHLAILTAVWPYVSICVYLVNVYASQGPEGNPLLSAISAAAVFAMPVLGLVGLLQDGEPGTLARYGMWVKIAHIPCYVLVFLVFWINPFGLPLYLFFDVMVLLSSAGLGIGALIRAGKAAIVSTGYAFLLGVMQVCFVLDVVSAVMLQRRLKS